MLTMATFRLEGDGSRTAAAVTARLGLAPTEAVEIGAPVGRSSTHRSTSLWLLSTSTAAEQIELGVQLHRLLTVLEPVAQPLWELVDAGCHASWFCLIASHATEHAVDLDRQLLLRLLALPGDLLLDVSGDD